MCGILGYLKKGTNSISIANLGKIQSHRGPDYFGSYEDAYISLGHNLLAIREVASSSTQPYTKPNSEWIVIFNGQLYNTKAMKAALDASANSIDLDTELLFRLIEKYKWDFIKHIQGMYAIGVYHKPTKTLKLYRDFSGQKHIYYFSKDSQFVFASELKTLMEFPGIDKTIDTDAVALATTIGYIPGNKTLFKYVQKLIPGEILSIDPSSGKLSSEVVRYTDSNYYPSSFEETFKQLISEHLQSKQSIAINLSGGLDSSLLVHEMSALGYKPITYTTRFNTDHDGSNIDADLALKLSKDYKTEHHEILVTKKTYLEHFAKAYSIVEEPNYNISLPAYLQIAEAEGITGDKHRVILSGNGGDELFGGYPYYERIHEIEKQKSLLTPFVYNLLKNYRNKTDLKYQNPTDQWLYTKILGRNWSVEKPSQRTIAEYLRNLWNTYAPLHDDPKGIKAAMVADRLFWMPAENFVQADRITMSQSMELRSPLSYDPFRFHMDKNLGIKDYKQRDGVNKPWLRDFYTNKLPHYITHRPDKTGWRSPIAFWYDQEAKNVFLSILEPYKHEKNIIDWSKVYEYVQKTDKWPGKYVHLYIALALFRKQFNVIL